MASPDKKLRRALRRVDDRLEQATPDVRAAIAAVAEADQALDELLAERRRRCERPTREWSDALRRQAEDDLQTIERLLVDWSPTAVLSSSMPWSTIAMLFQMTFEKIAKAVLAKQFEHEFRACLGKHKVVGKLLDALQSHKSHVPWPFEAKTLFPILRALERAHPALAQSDHLEYPWEDDDGVRLPSSLPLLVELPHSPWPVSARKFARDLLSNFDDRF